MYVCVVVEDDGRGTWRGRPTTCQMGSKPSHPGEIQVVNSECHPPERQRGLDPLPIEVP